MLQSFFTLQSRNSQFKKLHCIPVQYFQFTTKQPISFTNTLLENRQPTTSSETNHTLRDLSSLNFAGIAKTVISNCSHKRTDKGENFTNPSFKDYLLRLSAISPGTIRRFWRISELKPQDVLEILQGFEFDAGKYEIEVKKIESLWGIFKWASEENRGFEHLPQSCKIMASMLVQVGLFWEADCLLSSSESPGILLDGEIFSCLIEGYVGDFDLDSAVSIYERMRRLSLVPSLSSYRALLRYLIELNETQLAFRVFVDAFEMGMGMSIKEEGIFQNVIRLLCVDGKVQEARDFVKKVATFGIEPSSSVINAISRGYCKKKDYDDLVSFFAEVRFAPDVLIGNEILFSLCRNFGVEKASSYMHKLEQMGFCPDERTLGILIGWGCREGKLRNSFIYFLEILSRGLKPHLYSYNALLSGIFKAGMWRHSHDILHEMNDRGVTPDMSTLRVIIAGFCKERQFDEMKAVVGDMAERGLIETSLSEDPLNKAFVLLGLNPLDVKIRRDNDKGFSKAEFFDSLGNGLYLDTNLEEYEKTMTKVLDGAMIPDFNSFILENCGSRGKSNTSILMMIDEMARWGQELCLHVSSNLVKRLCADPFSIKTVDNLLEKMIQSVYQFEEKTLNKLVQTYSKNGFNFRARIIFDVMVQRHQIIENKTFTTQLMYLCNKGDVRGLRDCLLLARQYNWTPKFKDGIVLLDCLCQNKWLNEALELFETLLIVRPQMISDTFYAFLEKLCVEGFTTTACGLVEQFSNQTNILDQTVYCNLISGFCKEKRFEEAFKVCDTILAKNLSPPLDVTVLLITQLCRSNNFEKALALKNVCLKHQPSSFVSVHFAVMSGFCQSGKIEEATRLFKEMLLMKLVPDAEAYNMLVQAYCRVNNLEKIMELLGVMIRKELSISIPSYRNLVCLMCTKGKFPLALSLKELLLAERNLPDSVLYNILIFYLFMAHNTVLVDALIEELQKKGLQFDEVTYNFVVQGFLRSKDILSSLQYLTAMIEGDLRPSNRSLREVIRCLCGNGELGKTLKLSQEMELRGWIHCSTIQNNIVEALLTRGKLSEAIDFLDRMMIKGLIPDNIKYDYLIKRFCQHGRLDKAMDLLNTMLEKGSAPDSSSFDHIIQGFSNCRNLDMALDFHTEMIYRNLTPSTTTWNILVCRLSENGQAVEAEKLLYSMIQLGETPSKEMFCSVIDKYRSERNISKVSELLKMMQENGHAPDFDTHWSLISNLSNNNEKDESRNAQGFLSSLLSDFGFALKKPNTKMG
ncbi:pentatricopeptide repeat-containing protein At5g15280, mitochondrial [Olea europaea var. sylvestris]|uniref:pentatricopeptide repeat-containing protein At5g15280, mitochondrial n=1 Tax=Olea europaea var. sylvestris TaxID=158386 RepID=UPI000C1D6FF5|nr:pentatricopeptide repeat-containing protein At5g15280, mitochondrial [Olea europaea var. sylvestris]